MASYQGVATSIPKLHKDVINILMRVIILTLSLFKMIAFMQFMQFLYNLPTVNVLF